MDLKEILKKLGYTDEQISTVTAELQKNNLAVTANQDAGAETKKLQEELTALKAENSALKETQKNAAGTKKEPDAAKAGQDAGNTSEAAAEVKKLREQMEAERIRAAAVLELTKAHAQDVDYMMYLAEKDGSLKDLKIGDDGKVAGAAELVDTLKKAHAAQFTAEQVGSGSLTRTGIKKLEGQAGQETEPETLEEAIAQKYAEEEKGGQEG